MTDEQFAAEVRKHQAARWRASSLQAHARKHWKDFEKTIGYGLAPSEIDGLSRMVLRSWDRLFTELDHRQNISYAFAAHLVRGHAILVVVTRRGQIRTALPMESLDLWLQRHQAMVEVSERARRLDL